MSRVPLVFIEKIFAQVKCMLYNFHIMKIQECKILKASLIISLTMLTTQLAQAATFSVDFPRTAKPELDPFYNELDANGNRISGDGNSSVFEGVASEGSVTANMSGRYYDSDALDPGTTGLLNSDLPWNRKDPDVPEPGWLVRFGLEPDAVGSLVHTYNQGGVDETVVPASYISFQLKTPETVLFQNATLEIRDVYGVGPNTIWAATSRNGFTEAIVGNIQFTDDKGYVLSWAWNDLGVLDTGFEIRIYGFIGADEGTFGTGLLTGTYLPPPPVPEPGTSLMLGLVALGVVTFRKRR